MGTGHPVGANAFTMQVSYDFDSDGTPDRQEQYRMMTLSIGNSWTYENKQTHDKFDQQWPFAAPPMILGGPDDTKVRPSRQHPRRQAGHDHRGDVGRHHVPERERLHQRFLPGADLGQRRPGDRPRVMDRATLPDRVW